MKADEVSTLMDPNHRAKSDEGKPEAYIRMKCNLLEVAFHKIEANNVFSEALQSEEKFGWIPFPCGSFVDMLYQAFHLNKGDRSKRFLDVGAGIGSKVVLASVLFDSYGIELDPELVEKSKGLGIQNRIAVQDALLFDKYHEFDMIYYYRPIKDKELYLKLETKIYESIKSGSLIAPMDSEFDWNSQNDIEQLGQYWFKKK